MNIDFNKNEDGLVPAIIQDANTQKVLMLGYMNEEAFLKTNSSKQVTVYSRTKKRLWTKGEESVISWNWWTLSWIVIMILY